MKAKVIESGEIIDVYCLYPTTYSRLDKNNKIIEEYDENELEFIPNHNAPKMVSVDKACDAIKELLGGYIIRNFHFGDSYSVDEIIDDFKKRIEE